MATTSTYNPQQTFTYNGGAYGSNVSPVNLPNPSSDLASVLPNVSGLNSQLSGVIGSELSGQVSPGTMSLLDNAAASRGVSLGQPNSSISNGIGLNLLGTTSEQQQQAGVNNYNSTIPTISGTQTLNPALQMEGNLQNAVSAAAPNPTAAANQELSLLDQYMAELNPPNPAGGRGSFASAPIPQSMQLLPSTNSAASIIGTGGGYDGTNVGSYDPYSVYSTYGSSPSQPIQFQ